MNIVSRKVADLTVGVTARRSIKHGCAYRGKLTLAYQSWSAMNERCRNPKHHAWDNYGGRGITICDRWREFENFLTDMGERPGKEYTLDRYPDNNGNYEPGNCRWANRHEQQRNTSKNRRFTFNGETLCIAEWAQKLKMPYAVVRDRIVKYGWAPEVAFTVPYKEGSRSIKIKILKDASRPCCCDRPMQITTSYKPKTNKTYYGCPVCKSKTSVSG